MSRAEYKKNWQQTHKEHVNEYLRLYRAKNAERLNELRRKKYQETGKEKTYLRIRRSENRELYRKYAENQRKKDRTKLAANQQIYATLNPEKIMAQRVTKKMPLDSTCLLCPPNDPNTDDLLHHHPDYSIPDFYVTVCPSCHVYLLNGGD